MSGVGTFYVPVVRVSETDVVLDVANEPGELKVTTIFPDRLRFFDFRYYDVIERMRRGEFVDVHQQKHIAYSL